MHNVPKGNIIEFYNYYFASNCWAIFIVAARWRPPLAQEQVLVRAGLVPLLGGGQAATCVWAGSALRLD